MEEVQDKWQIKNIIHYLVKWEGWLLEYNLYKPASYLAGTLKAILNYECKVKHKKSKWAIDDESNMKWQQLGSIKLTTLLLPTAARLALV